MLHACVSHARIAISMRFAMVVARDVACDERRAVRGVTPSKNNCPNIVRRYECDKDFAVACHQDASILVLKLIQWPSYTALPSTTFASSDDTNDSVLLLHSNQRAVLPVVLRHRGASRPPPRSRHIRVHLLGSDWWCQ